MAEEVTKSGLLDALTGAVQGYKQQESGGTGGTVAAIVAFVMVIIAVAMYAWQAWKSGKEKAKLLHEQAWQQELQHQAIVDSAMAHHEEERRAALARAEKARREGEALERARLRVEGEHREVRERIDAIVSWDDVDSFLDGDS
jgi:hypothetical protein